MHLINLNFFSKMWQPHLCWTDWNGLNQTLSENTKLNKKSAIATYLTEFRRRLTQNVVGNCGGEDCTFVNLIMLIISQVAHVVISMLNIVFTGQTIAIETIKFILDWTIDLLNTKSKCSFIIKTFIFVSEVVIIIFLLSLVVRIIFIPIINVQLNAANEILETISSSTYYGTTPVYKKKQLVAEKLSSDLDYLKDEKSRSIKSKKSKHKKKHEIDELIECTTYTCSIEDDTTENGQPKKRICRT
ncbi:uncharacterized protein LOC142330228 [Lycorma delicatula]|uniref:uncharacterized protein LOC142330228 n=1 Tax=Lycorma delicatula TaxID=130591 RepID=UPI003F511007